MKKSVKSSATSRKGRNVSVSSSSVVNSPAVVAPAGAGVTAGGVAPIKSGVVSISHKVAKESNNDRLAAAAAMVDDVRISALRQQIVTNFFAPAEWSGAAALRSSLAALGLDETAITAAINKQAIAEGFSSAAPVCSVARVLAVIRRHYRKEFENACGCSFGTLVNFFRSAGLPAGSLGFSWSLALPLSLVVAGSDAADFVTSSPLPAGSSASAVVAGVLSFRWYAAFRRSLAGAICASRRDLLDNLSGVVRSARRLGLSLDWLNSAALSAWSVVPENDGKERRRLIRNLATQSARLAAVDARLIVCCPAISDVDTSGDFFVPASAALPASAGRAARRLYAGRARLLSTTATLQGLISLGC